MQALWAEPHRIGLWRRIWLALAEAERELGLDDSRRRRWTRCGPTSTTSTSPRAAAFEAPIPPRRDGAHPRLRRTGPGGAALPPPRRHQRLRDRQRRRADRARCACGWCWRACWQPLAALREFARRYRVAALPCVHPFPTGAADHGGQAGHAVDAGPGARRRSGAAAARDARVPARLQGRPPERRRRSSSCSAATTPGCANWSAAWPTSWGWPASFPVTGQTYPRKADSQVLDWLSGVAQSASKFAVDLRLLQHEGELLEPFEAEQIGSSAMAVQAQSDAGRADRRAGALR